MSARPEFVGATYRLQLGPAFGFRAAAAVVPYLQRLGITHVYTSPVLASQPGSDHGYDLVDPSRIDTDLGGDEGFEAFLAALAEHGLGLVLDFVPNHMGVRGQANPWWNDVLENGRASPYADFFDIDWNPPKTSLAGRILLPVLGSQYGEALERGELALECTDGAFFIRYFEHRLPIAPDSVVGLLEEAGTRLDGAEAGLVHSELSSIATALRNLPPRSPEITREQRTERAREVAVQKRRLGQLCAAEPAVAEALQYVVACTNGRTGDPRSFDRLDSLLSSQAYRLSSWRVAAEQINYRRFFDVNELAALRMEDPVVFEATHTTLLRLIAERRIEGLRLDHIDGLYDPRAYLERVRARIDEALGADAGERFYIVVEKILGAGEALPDWPIAGTTGYDFLAMAGGLWVAPGAAAALNAFHHRFTGDTRTWEDVAHASKLLVVTTLLAGEIHILTRQLERIADADRRSRDFTFMNLTTAVVETIAAFPVYRSYVRPDGGREPGDDAHIRLAIRRAARHRPEVNVTVFHFLRDVLLLDPRFTDPELRAKAVHFTMRFQQITGSVMAKAIEDTAFYRASRLLALNEVGNDPSRFGTSVETFHAFCSDRASCWPETLDAGSTHDTKRGEDARARLAVLSEMPEEWRRAVGVWSRWARSRKIRRDDELMPSRADEYFFYQTLVGVLPPAGAPTTPHSEGATPGLDELRTRLLLYMEKVVKEAKEHSSWVNPDPEYEAALRSFVEKMLEDARFIAHITSFCSGLAVAGATNSLSEVLLRCTCPGAPDVYRGSELWNQSLVDPDNRRPVDFELRESALAAIEAGEQAPGAQAAALLERFADGTIKMFVLHRTLRCRAQHPELFRSGTYEPLESGEHIVAFLRRHTGTTAIVVVPRLVRGLSKGRGWPLGEAWGRAALTVPAGEYRDALTGERFACDGSLPLGTVLGILPVALLLAEPAPRREVA